MCIDGLRAPTTALLKALQHQPADTIAGPNSGSQGVTPSLERHKPQGCEHLGAVRSKQREPRQ